MTQEELLVLKNRYPNHRLIYINICNKEFIFRTLTKEESKQIYSLDLARNNFEDLVCQVTCVYPEEYDFQSGIAGLPEKICPYIEKYSGLIDPRFTLSWYREERDSNNLEQQCKDLIKAFIPEYTYEQMESWTWETLMRMTARAEKVARYKGFEWKLEDNSDEFIEQLNEYRSDNKEFVSKLYNSGIDPMNYFSAEIEDELKPRVLDIPFITNKMWNDEEVLYAVRQQRSSAR